MFAYWQRETIRMYLGIVNQQFNLLNESDKCTLRSDMTNATI